MSRIAGSRFASDLDLGSVTLASRCSRLGQLRLLDLVLPEQLLEHRVGTMRARSMKLLDVGCEFVILVQTALVVLPECIDGTVRDALGVAEAAIKSSRVRSRDARNVSRRKAATPRSSSRMACIRSRARA